MKTNRLVFDIEANGLLKEMTSVHCFCIKNIDTGEATSLYESSLTSNNILETILKYPTESVEVIGHNIISFDLPLLHLWFDIDLWTLLDKDAIIDTYLWSKVLNPDREMPRGCPTSIKNPVTNRLKKIGPHGLESWGYRVGERKIEINDWRYFDEEMLLRCSVDVEINERVYYSLLKEAGLTI
jgi:hypothetical protein